MLVINGRFLRNAQPAGMQRVGRALLDRIRADGLDLEVMAPPGVVDPRVDRTVGRTPASRAGDLAWEQTALPLAAARRPILSLCNTAPLAARRSAVMLHDLAWLVNPDWYSRTIRGYSAVVLNAARRADVVLTVSDTVAGELVNHGIDARRLRVVRNAIDDDVGPASAETVAAVRDRLGLLRPYLLMVGWSNPRKDTATALAAHARVALEIPHDLVAVGPLSPTFNTVDLRETASVRVFGYTDRADLLALMTGAAAFVYPTRYEGFGLPPLEALACGTPALVSDLPVLHESAGRSAVFIPVGDVEAWAHNMAAALRGEIEAGPAPAWTWKDAGSQLAAALEPIL